MSIKVFFFLSVLLYFAPALSKKGSEGLAGFHSVGMFNTERLPPAYKCFAQQRLRGLYLALL